MHGSRGKGIKGFVGGSRFKSQRDNNLLNKKKKKKDFAIFHVSTIFDNSATAESGNSHIT